MSPKFTSTQDTHREENQVTTEAELGDGAASQGTPRNDRTASDARRQTLQEERRDPQSPGRSAALLTLELRPRPQKKSEGE